MDFVIQKLSRIGSGFNIAIRSYRIEICFQREQKQKKDKTCSFHFPPPQFLFLRLKQLLYRILNNNYQTFINLHSYSYPKELRIRYNFIWI